MEIDVRITIPYDGDDSEAILEWEDEILKQVFDSTPNMVIGVVVLRNDGFGNLLPDEDTRKTRDTRYTTE